MEPIGNFFTCITHESLDIKSMNCLKEAVGIKRVWGAVVGEEAEGAAGGQAEQHTRPRAAFHYRRP